MRRLIRYGDPSHIEFILSKLQRLLLARIDDSVWESVPQPENLKIGIVYMEHMSELLENPHA